MINRRFNMEIIKKTLKMLKQLNQKKLLKQTLLIKKKAF